MRGLAAALGAWVVLLIAVISLWRGSDWVVDNAHYVAAFSLLLCIFVVAAANAYRRRQEKLPTSIREAFAVAGSPRRYRYTFLAAAMLVLTLVGILLFSAGTISLFVLEIVVAFLFALFWMVQTVELGQTSDKLQQGSQPVQPVATPHRPEEPEPAT